MSFFQNLFDQEFQGYLILADRKLAPTFKVAANQNLQSKQVAWNKGPYDFSASGRRYLKFNFAWDVNFKAWAQVDIDVSGDDISSTLPAEVVSALNDDPVFSSTLLASVTKMDDGESVLISKKTSKNVKFYFSNNGAEEVLGFNKRAGVAELPSYFERHTIANVNQFDDSTGILIHLDETDPIDQVIIQSAGFDPGSMKADWQLLRGRGSGLFTFKKQTVDGSDRVTQIIEYPAGSMAGDFARKINYSYTSTNKSPDSVTEVPYVLTEVDLITP